MKNASVILSHLVGQPQFKSLKRHACYKKFLSLLGTKWQKAIAFVYIRNETLFVAVTHPGFKMELHYNRDLLKSVLTQLASLDTECRELKAEKVIIFHSKYRTVITEKGDKTTIPYYHERATGNFSIKSSDEALAEKLKQTQSLIACNQ